ncbi:YicC family protein [Pseudooceanicola sp. CBS1P-1]|uniref:YicC family protein n=2 Tax=Paracoccaceae TaxID=31989 RepID=A0A6L7FZW0_9RHOB|nr:YicC family protein [Pseudooceanicola endophyticus]MXN17644.1 YicC family protein [Pseudooceanicola albus]
MTQSMTAFAAGQGSGEGYGWTWELRSVNGKGLDLRLRVPDWVPGLEAALRARLTEAMARGNVTLSLRLSRDEGITSLRVNEGQLAAVLAALVRVEQAAARSGVPLAPSRAADLLGQRGVLEMAAADEDASGLKPELLADLEPVLAQFLAMRAAEGAALRAVMTEQLAQIEALVTRADAAAEARLPRQRAAMEAALTRVLSEAAGTDPQRLTQELALIAIKADVTEELDRLRAHVGAARDLLAQAQPVGRRLDFLMQEFNREANTLCSKAQDPDLTAVGLELKTIIDQLREQVQNVE